MNIIHKFNQWVDRADLAKLILRVTFAAMLSLHGIHKIGAGGTSFIKGLLVENGLPTFIAYGVYLGEVLAPLLIILGIFTRLSAFVVIGTCFFIIFLAYMPDFFSLTKVGAWALEPVATYLFAFTAIMFAGSGRYAIKPD